MMQHTNTIATLPALINPTLPSVLTTIIMRCIAKDPWARFPTVSSLVDALAQAGGQEEKEVPTQYIPQNVAQPDYPIKATDLPTVLTGPPSTSAGMMPPALTPSSQGRQIVAFNYTPTSSGIAGSAPPTPVIPAGG